ncbi:MAG: hypothetical protein V4631_20010 [Pseudomonadota bacterium]
MENQKSNDGNARNVGTEGSGSSMGKDMSKDSGISKGASDMHKSIDKAAESAQPMADRLASSAHAGVDKMSSALTDVSGRMDEKTKQLGEAYKNFAETGRGYVRSSPATSVLVALGAGFVLSKLLGRRH